MDRKVFIKRLTAAAIGIVVAKPIIDALPKPIQRSYIHGSTQFNVVFDRAWSPSTLSVAEYYKKYPLTYEEVFRLDEEGKEVYMNANGEVIITPKPIQYESNTDASKGHSKPTT